jgi:hypothetical protein
MAGWGLWHGMPGAPRALRIGIAASGGALAAVMLSTGTLPPFRPMQVVDAAGIGPFITYDTVRGLTVLDRSPGLVWRIAGVAAAFGSVALLATGFEAARRAVRLRRGASPHAVFLLAVIGAYLVPFILVDYFDRYLLFVLPFAMALWAITWKGAAPPAPVRRAAAVAWIVATLLVAALATRDYFAWNRARWDAIREAQRRGATPATLDGGFEYNGYTGYETRRSPGPQGGSLEAKSWYWVVDDDYVVAFGPVPGYRELRTFPVKRWLSRTPGEVVLLRRIR